MNQRWAHSSVDNQARVGPAATETTEPILHPLLLLPQIALQGLAHVEKMTTFYNAPPALFTSGQLGGFRITGRKPENLSLAEGRRLVLQRKINDMTQAEVEKLLDAQKTVSVDDE